MGFTLIVIFIAIFSIVLHEIAHGYVAYLYGDNTAYNAGRLTLNPLPHLDIVGSLIVPFVAFSTFGMIFGWAKPVPVNESFIHSKTGKVLVSFAGILMNFLIALAMLVLANSTDTKSTKDLFILAAYLNIALGLFNLLPVPPFDGSQILNNLFPRMNFIKGYMYNPFWMVGAILFGAVVFRFIAPYITSFINLVS